MGKMNRHLAISFFIIAFPVFVQADTVTIVADKDNTIYQNSGGLSNGKGNQLTVGKLGTRIAIADNLKVRRALVFFDIANDANIPSGATINSVILTVRVSKSAPGSGNQVVALHRITANWGEGNSRNNIGGGDDGLGAPANTNDVTWTHTFSETQQWSTPGGDFIAEPSATEMIGGIGSYTWDSSNHSTLGTDVRGWINDSTTNFGWLLKHQNESPTQTARRFDSREASTVGNRPTLTIEFTPESNMPVALCQPTTVEVGTTGNASITGPDVDGGSTGTNLSLSVSPDTFSCNDVGSNMVTLTVTDGSGNTSSCTSAVTVEDTVAPTAQCDETSSVSLDVNSTGSLSAAMVDDGSSDACGISSLSLSQTSFDCTDVGTKTLTLTVTDNNSNTSTCTTSVTVKDLIAPIASCKNITVQLDSRGNADIAGTDVDGGSSDICDSNLSLNVSPWSFGCTDVGTNIVTLTVADDSANSSTCNATITIVNTDTDSNQNGIPDECDDDVTIIELDPGWNLIGISVTPDNQPVDLLFNQTDRRVWRWNADRQLFQVETVLSPGRGYWLFFPGATGIEVTIPGASAVNLPISVKKGWNLIAALKNGSIPVNASIVGSVWSWEDNRFSVVNEIERGRGYWLYSNDEDILSQ